MLVALGKLGLQIEREIERKAGAKKGQNKGSVKVGARGG
jgi:hypothetical protein